ncbi:hypothetical protein B296_00022417 [Ensete ventricosum]|uniref:Uncharacterized protein n=1 Tax=Ensete ventricosum TaxID=4639 RepID=A0A426YR29_ENSVE|nr:hypothetical protein B296_00022417 [Ensete ventricosum]
MRVSASGRAKAVRRGRGVVLYYRSQVFRLLLGWRIGIWNQRWLVDRGGPWGLSRGGPTHIKEGEQLPSKVENQVDDGHLLTTAFAGLLGNDAFATSGSLSSTKKVTKFMPWLGNRYSLVLCRGCKVVHGERRVKRARLRMGWFILLLVMQR